MDQGLRTRLLRWFFKADTDDTAAVVKYVPQRHHPHLHHHGYGYSYDTNVNLVLIALRVERERRLSRTPLQHHPLSCQCLLQPPLQSEHGHCCPRGAVPGQISGFVAQLQS